MKPTQKQMVLEHLKQYGSLDPFTAFREYGIFTALHARITELRKEGHKIHTDHITGKSNITGRQWKIANYIYLGQSVTPVFKTGACKSSG